MSGVALSPMRGGVAPFLSVSLQSSDARYRGVLLTGRDHYVSDGYHVKIIPAELQECMHQGQVVNA